MTARGMSFRDAFTRNPGQGFPRFWIPLMVQQAHQPPRALLFFTLSTVPLKSSGISTQANVLI